MQTLLKKWKSIQTRVIPDTRFILTYDGYPTHDGYPTQKCTIDHAIKRYSGKVSIHSIRIHDLRNLHASLLI